MRQDLFALTPDDLVILSNRGLVNRSQKELAANTLTWELEEDAQGNVSCHWSDGVDCTLPVDRPLTEDCCTCTATTLCRHLIRSILAYQLNFTTPDPSSTPPPQPTSKPEFGIWNSEFGILDPKFPSLDPEPHSRSVSTEENLNSEFPQLQAPKAEPSFPDSEFRSRSVSRGEIPNSELRTPNSPWNPGEISDETLTQVFKPTVLSRAKQVFSSGQVIELVRSRKPTAHFHTLACTLRFLVPHDLRYTHCDCADPAPCSHVPLAVWAFRQLAPDRLSGLITPEAPEDPAATQAQSHTLNLLAEVEQCLHRLLEVGIAGANAALLGQLKRLEKQCRETALIWPAEILGELQQQHQYYSNHDARFSATEVLNLVGELCIRSDAIRQPSSDRQSSVRAASPQENRDPVPQLFIRGSKNDRPTDLGSARLMGLGSGVRVKQKSIQLMTYLQDTDSGTLMVVCREFVDLPEDSPDPPRPFWQLAQTSAMKRTSYRDLGASQLLIKGGKRSPNHQFLPGRAPGSVNPQAFNWETLRPPVLVEDWTELQSRLAQQPPAALRPRRLTEDFQVLVVNQVSSAQFSATEQAIYAQVEDVHGNTLLLHHPYTSRSSEGTETLLTALTQFPQQLRFISGSVSLTHQGLTVDPVGLVFEITDSSSSNSSKMHRILLQPWVDRPSKFPLSKEQALPELRIPNSELRTLNSDQASRNPKLATYLHQLQAALAELFLIGLQRADLRTLRQWQEIHDYGGAIGFSRLLESTMALVGQLEAKLNRPNWQGQEASEVCLVLTVLSHLAQSLH